MLRVLRQLRSKDGGGGRVPCRATPRGAWPGAAFCTTAVNLRQIEFGEFGSGSAKNTGGHEPPSFGTVIHYSTKCATLTL